MNSLTLEVAPSSHNRLVSLFRLKGYLDAVTVSQIEKKFREQMDSGSYRWVVDLTELEYISSAGLGSFIGVLEEVRSHGGDIFFTGLSQKMQKIFQILGFTRIFRLFPDEATAVKEFGTSN